MRALDFAIPDLFRRAEASKANGADWEYSMWMDFLQERVCRDSTSREYNYDYEKHLEDLLNGF